MSALPKEAQARREPKRSTAVDWYSMSGGDRHRTNIRWGKTMVSQLPGEPAARNVGLVLQQACYLKPATISNSEIAKRSGLSENKVQDALLRLEDLGMIQRKKVQGRREIHPSCPSGSLSQVVGNTPQGGTATYPSKGYPHYPSKGYHREEIRAEPLPSKVGVVDQDFAGFDFGDPSDE
jgi:hypothetical protein